MKRSQNKGSCQTKLRTQLSPLQHPVSSLDRVMHSKPVAGAAAKRPSNGAVAGELKRYALVHLSFCMDGNPVAMNRQGWEPCQVGYDSDSSNDGYFTCEDSLSTYQIDNVEFHHRARFEAIFEGLVQERTEIMEAQKRIEVQLLTAAELASSELSFHDTITAEGRNMRGMLSTRKRPPPQNKKQLPVKIKKVVDPNFNSLPFPAIAKKMRKVKLPDPPSLSSSKRWR
ncbi:hypothetical protein PIB30_045348 [Stylosanthes scabra]|uniref:Uncharacterized protein n=1 Tax=Stylosanthes scabra TaxID=79078 RepID=A0ABU6QFL8_9FABA|nr:hypothetical protein [Stylosanthes scabra]